MNRDKVLLWFKSNYPNNTSPVILIPENSDDVYEAIQEVSRADDGSSSTAIALIEWSERHFHRSTKETYTLVSGRLSVTLDDEIVTLETPDSTLTIEPNVVHFASSLEPGIGAVVEVECIPAWTKDDHFLITSAK